MPQLVNKRRSRWAVLVVSALVASSLAVTGASPVIAAEQQADAQATWTACLGPAKAGHGFNDVNMGSVHYDNINCLAYYGITVGTTAGTYDPLSGVTRSQMALFLTRMAKVAGVNLGDAMDAGFSDLGSTGADRVAAINRLVSKGIMEGRTATTFDPGGIVTRADMAQHLFAFADLALDTVHIDTLPTAVDGDGTGIELNVVNGDGTPVDDWFGDARRTTPAHVDKVIGAAYELGITTGTNNMVGERGTFEPTRPVTRAQMASFIMRTLGHTNLRPAGVTAQQTRTSTQVSVRDTAFAPIAGTSVELFTTNFADDVFDARGRCIDRYVSNSGFGFETGWDACEIDGGDQRTDSFGNHVFPIGTGGRPTMVCTHELTASGLSDPDTKYGVWAWTGEFGDTVGHDTDLTVPEGANSQTGLRTPARAVLSGGTSYDLKMGRDTVTYTLQLLDRDGDPVGPEPDVNRSYTITTYVIDTGANTSPDALDVSTAGQLVSATRKTVETRRADSSGRIVVGPIAYSDLPLIDQNYVVVVVDVVPASGNDAAVTDATTDAAVTVSGRTTALTADDGNAVAVFSDDDAVASSYKISARSWGRHSSTGNRTEITITLLDQYGRSNTGADATADPAITSSSFSVTPNGGTAISGTVGRDGIARIVYTSPDTDRTETLGTGSNPAIAYAGANADNISAPTTASKVYWAEPGSAESETTGAIVRVLDPAARSLVVGGGAAEGTATDDVLFYNFGPDDTFTVEGTALSFAQFMEVLAAANNPDIPEIRIAADGTTLLTWSDYNVSRPRDRASWTITGICSS